MLKGVTNRIPICLVRALHEAVSLGSTYACLSLLAAWVGSLLHLDTNLTNRLGL